MRLISEAEKQMGREENIYVLASVLQKEQLKQKLLKRYYIFRVYDSMKARLEKRPCLISRCSSGSLIITTSTWCCLKFHLQSIQIFYTKLERES